MLTAKKFAERAGITYPTVIAWLKKGLIPHAKFIEDSPLGPYWEIPATSLAKVRKQKTGPKPKVSIAGANGDSGEPTAPADGADQAEASAASGAEVPADEERPKRRASKKTPAKKAMKMKKTARKKGARTK